MCALSTCFIFNACPPNLFHIQCVSIQLVSFNACPSNLFHSMRVHQCVSIKLWSFNLFHSYVLSSNLFHSLVSWLLDPSVIMELPMNANCVVQHRHAIESTRISSKCVVQHMGGGKHNQEVVPRCTNNMFCSVYMYAFLLTAYMFRQALCV